MTQNAKAYSRPVPLPRRAPNGARRCLIGFSFISMNWRAVPLTSLRVIVDLIAATTTTTGLTIQAAHDPNWYPKGVKISDTELAALPLTAHEWHGEWNYTLNAQPHLT